MLDATQMKRKLALVIGLLLMARLGACGGGASQTGDSISGLVVGVHDGDSLRVLTVDGVLDVRLEGIDAPELYQQYGLQARDELARATLAKWVTLIVNGEDRYSRTLAEVRTQGGPSINELQVRTGLAWHFKRYSKDAELEALESTAREMRLGLWADPVPVAPWDYRAGVRSQMEPDVERGVEASVRGNRRSRRYHVEGCEGFDKIAPKNRVAFSSEQAALDAGYVRAGNCR